MTARPSLADWYLRGTAVSAALLQGLFIALRLAGITDWNWWAVMSPVLTVTDILAGIVLLVLAVIVTVGRGLDE